MRTTEPVDPASCNCSAAGPYPDDRDSFDVDRIIGFIHRNWRLCAIWVAAALCAAFAFLLIAPTYYTAYATLVLYDGGARAMAANVADAAASTYVDTQIEVLQSAEVVDKVIGEFQLTKDPEFGGSTAQDRHTAAVKFAKALRVARIGTSNAVSVGFTARSPSLAAEIANAIVRNYIDGVRERKREERADTVAEIRDRLMEIRDKAFSTSPLPSLSSETPESVGQSLARFREQQDSSETYRAIYNNLLQQTNTALFSEFAEPAVRVISSAEPPLYKSWPKSFLLLGFAAAVGSIAGIGQALLRETANRSLRTCGEVRQSTGLDCVPVPAMEDHALSGGNACRPGLQPAYRHASAEFSRALVRLAIRLQRGRRKRPFVVGVGAPETGAGVSTAAAHLASLLAETGDKALLVDANWRKPDSGLDTAEHASGGVPSGERGAIPVRADRSGPGYFDALRLRPAAASPVGASLSVADAVQQLPPDYDWIVVDFHSAEETPDLEAGSSALDAVIVVIEAGRTRGDDLHLLLGALPRDKVAAVIVNKVAPGPAGFRAEFAHFAQPFIGIRKAALRLAPSVSLAGKCRAILGWCRSRSRQAAPIDSGLD